MSKKQFNSLFKISIILAAVALLLAAGAALAQNTPPGSEPSPGLEIGSQAGQAESLVQTPDQPDGSSSEPETGEKVELFSPQGYVDGMAPDDNLEQATGRTSADFSYYHVTGPELQPRSTANEQAYAAAGCIYMSSGSGYGLATGTGLHLPDGSIIKYLRLYFRDTTSAQHVNAFLTRYTPGTEFKDLVSTGSTNAFNSGLGFVVSSEIAETVDNKSYSYMVYGLPEVAGSSLQVCGIRVAYYTPTAAALFLPVLAH